MNYLSHAYRFLDDAYFIAGTGLPDWMNGIDRKNRARRQFAEPVTAHRDPRIAAVARGCVQHHDDDLWFHQLPGFVLLSTQFAVEIRQLLEPGLGHQAGFVGHIAVELLLDATLAERQPQSLERYYAQLATLDIDVVSLAANAICRQPVTRLAELLPRFIELRFLADYADDRLLLRSFNGVMRRINLPQLPVSLMLWLPSARKRVRAQCDDLLRRPQGNLP